MKKKIEKIFKISIFLIIVICGISMINPYYAGRNKEDFNYQAFRKMKENPDILIFGSSLANCSISPVVLYDSYGLTSFNLAARGQKPITTNYVIKEACKIHKPKIVVIVLDYMDQAKGSATLTEDILTTKEIRTSLCNNFRFLQKNFKGNSMEYIKYFFPLFQFHDKILKGEMDEIEGTETGYYKYLFRKGFMKEYGQDGMEEVLKDRHQQELSLEYIALMDEVVDFCEEKDIKLMFVSLPNSDHAIYTESFKKQFQQCDFLDYYDLFHSIGLNFKTDYYDDYHMNYNGAQKVSHYLSQYIQLKYQLPDHRGDQGNDLWKITKQYFDDIGYDNYKTDNWMYYLETKQYEKR